MQGLNRQDKVRMSLVKKVEILRRVGISVQRLRNESRILLFGIIALNRLFSYFST